MKKKNYPFEISKGPLPKDSVLFYGDEKDLKGKMKRISKTHILFTEVNVPGKSTVLAKGMHLINRTGRYFYLPKI